MDPSSSTSSGPIRIDGYDHDAALSKSKFLTRIELLRRRSRRLKQLSVFYRDYYWLLMELVKSKYREYYWEYGISPFVDDEEDDKVNSNRRDCTAVAVENVSNGNLGVNGGIGNGNVANRCGVHGCKAKAMALTKFCHMHILSDGKQKLYKPCRFPIKSSTSGPILCGKPILRSTIPCYCTPHYQKAEKHMVRALKKVGLNVSSVSKLSPKLHDMTVELTDQIRYNRRAGKKNPGTTEVKEEINS